MIAKSKTIIFLVMFILKSPLSQIVVLRAEIAFPGQFSITSFCYFSFFIVKFFQTRKVITIVISYLPLSGRGGIVCGSKFPAAREPTVDSGMSESLVPASVSKVVSER
jgi:hypothetical protein